MYAPTVVASSWLLIYSDGNTEAYHGSSNMTDVNELDLKVLPAGCSLSNATASAIDRNSSIGRNATFWATSHVYQYNNITLQCDPVDIGEEPSSKSSGLGTGMIVGIVLFSVAFVAFFLFLWCVISGNGHGMSVTDCCCLRSTQCLAICHKGRACSCCAC